MNDDEFGLKWVVRLDASEMGVIATALYLLAHADIIASNQPDRHVKFQELARDIFDMGWGEHASIGRPRSVCALGRRFMIMMGDARMLELMEREEEGPPGSP